jgi:hypothetical protein
MYCLRENDIITIISSSRQRIGYPGLITISQLGTHSLKEIGG